MRWELYLAQTLGSGTIALAVASLAVGIMSWWLLFQKAPWLERWRPQLNSGFWTVIVLIYLAFFVWLCFYWPA